MNGFAIWFLPYCLQLTEQGYLVLNRQYKPVGIKTAAFVDYAGQPAQLPLQLTGREAASLAHNSSENLAKIFLYNDHCAPLQGNAADDAAYMRRLAELERLVAALA